MSIPPKVAIASAGAGRRPSVTPSKSQTAPARSPSRLTASTTTSSPATSNAAKTRSTRTGTATGAPPSARSAVRKSISLASKTATPDGSVEDDARAGAAAAALEDMRERLQKAELAVEEHKKQAAVLQARLDDSNKEHSKLEESVHEHQERMEELENEKKENIRKRRELESIYEADQAAAIKEREEAQAREDELRNTVQRLKESATQKEMRTDGDSRPDLSRPCMPLLSRHTPLPSFSATLLTPLFFQRASEAVRLPTPMVLTLPLRLLLSGAIRGAPRDSCCRRIRSSNL